MHDPFQLIVVGGGLAGAALARSLAEKGARVVVIERDEKFTHKHLDHHLKQFGV